jgi:hypothetical protein
MDTHPAGAIGTPPGCDPDERDPSHIAPADSYRRNEAVWVYRNGSWHPGVVNGVSPLAVMVTYQSILGRGTVVDTVTPQYLMPHGESNRTTGGDH